MQESRLKPAEPQSQPHQRPEGQWHMADTPWQSNNSVKAFDELTADQKERALAMFAPLRPHTEYLYEIDSSGEVRCRRYSKAQKMAGPFQG
jgi:hypothetical protein